MQALQHVSHNENWQLIHISTILSVLLWVVAFFCLAHSVHTRAAASMFGKLSVASITIGAAIFAVDYAIDGHTFPALARAYEAASSSTDKERIYSAFYTLFSGLGATFPLYIGFLFGLPFLLAGIAVSCSKLFPRWLGWIAVIGGLGNFIAGFTMFIDWPIIPEEMVFGGFGLLLNIWLVLIGILMWRKSK